MMARILVALPLVGALSLAGPVRAQGLEEAAGGDASVEAEVAGGVEGDVGAPEGGTAQAPRAREEDAEPAAPERPMGPVEPIAFELDNGLRVVLLPLPGRRFCGLAVTYGVGSSSVPDGWTGLAHLTEHLMFAGTDVLGEVEIYLRLEEAGAVDRNGETGPDRSVFYERLPASQLRWALYLESERMARMPAGLTAQRLERQRQVVLHEGWERGVYGWRGGLTHNLYGGLFGGEHPYGRIVEREGDVQAIELRHVQWFFQQHYAPDNATLTVVGGFDPAVLRAEIERYFGPVRRTGPRPDAREVEPVRPLDHERHITVEIQDDRDQLYVAWPTPALYDEGDAALDVISSLLFDRRDSPIRAALLESGLALEVAVRQRSHALGSVFTIHAIPGPGHSVEELRETIDRVLSEVRRDGFTEAQVAEARERWDRLMRLSAEDVAQRAILLGTGTETYLPTIERERARYSSVTAEEVRAVLDRYLPARRRLLLVAHANPRTRAEGRVTVDERILLP